MCGKVCVTKCETNTTTTLTLALQSQYNGASAAALRMDKYRILTTRRVLSLCMMSYEYICPAWVQILVQLLLH